MVIPYFLHASFTSSSRIEPPGWRIYLTLYTAAASTLSANGNNEHALKTGLRKVKKIEQYTLDRKYIKTFSSTKEAMDELGVCHKSLWVASHGYEDDRTCKGFRLKVIG